MLALFKKLILFSLLTFLLATVSSEAEARPKIQAFPDFDGAVYFSTFETWGTAASPTHVRFIKYITKDGQEKYWIAAASAMIKSPFASLALFTLDGVDYRIHQFPERSYLYTRTHGYENYPFQYTGRNPIVEEDYQFFEVPDYVMERLRNVPENKIISLTFSSNYDSKPYQVNFTPQLRESLAAMSLLSQKDFKDYCKNPPQKNTSPTLISK